MSPYFVGIAGRYLVNQVKRIIMTASLKYLLPENAIPLVITPDTFPAQREFIFSHCRAFILPGGDDIDPIYYNEPSRGARKIDKKTDALDYAILDYAVKNRIPVLGICRGIQVINVYFGGSLIQHLTGLALFLHDHANHEITLTDPRFFPTPQTVTVNSSHHQALKALGDNLIPFAKSSDGLVEGLYHATLPLIAVAWHPEQQPNQEINQAVARIFADQIHHQDNNTPSS